MQKLRNLLGGGISSLIKIGIFSIVWILYLQEVVAYEPGSITGKYQSGVIESSIWDSWWLATTMSGNWGTSIVRQSLSPSAMVDGSGRLFTLNFYNSNSSSGIYFHLRKFTESNYSVSCSCKSVYPWSYFATDLRATIPSDTPISLNMGAYPNFSKDGNDRFYFSSYIHNAYNGCIAQDVGDTSHIVVVWPIPNLRIAANSGDFDGILYLDFSKDTLSQSEVGRYSGYNQGNGYSYANWRPRRMSSNDYNIEMGNYTAWHYGSSIHLNWVALQSFGDWSTAGVCWQYNNRWCDYSSSGYHCSGYPATGVAVYPRYIKFGDYIYGMCAYQGGYYTLITRSGVSEGDFASVQDWYEYFRMRNCLSESWNYYTTSQYDFCIVKAPDGSGMICVLGIRPVCESSSSFTKLSSSYNREWGSNFLSWGRNQYCLMLSSRPISGTSITYEEPQNMIYTTELNYGNQCAVNCNCSKNFGQYGIKQLYKNTHKCCVYTGSDGNQYIIYCYCYPGKTAQLYLGYAMCCVDEVDGCKKVRLGSKFEFRASGAPWSTSFSNFTDCTRIVSMDCKDGHLWITWMGSNDSKYYYFHILAKDLIEE